MTASQARQDLITCRKMWVLAFAKWCSAREARAPRVLQREVVDPGFIDGGKARSDVPNEAMPSRKTASRH
eukprot:11194371-Lingulodinium_polyedra.AAC.1